MDSVKIIVMKNIHAFVFCGMVFVALIAVVIPAITFAGPGNITPVPPPNNLDVGGRINFIIDWAFGLLLVLAGVFILYAAFLYLGSGGSEEKVAKAKKYIIYAVVAIVVAALARTVVFIVKALLNIT